jgi:hypothetical protein
MSDLSGGQTAILPIIWWWQKLGRDAVSKQTMHLFHMERFNLKKSNEVEGKEQVLIQVGKLLEYKNVSQSESRLL